MPAKQTSSDRRERIETGIYRRGGKFVIGWPDVACKWRWRTLAKGATLTAARRELRAEQAKADRGEQAADPRLTFDRACDEWKATWDARDIRPTTRVGYDAALTHLRTHFGKRQLSSIGVADVARYVAKQKKASKKGWTIKSHLGVLSAVFKYAERLGHAGPNPVGLLDRGERPTTHDAKAARVLSPDEVDRLIAAVDEHYRLIFEVAAETGARKAEVLGLTWADVDGEAGAIHFEEQLARTGKRVPLKTSRSRRIVEVSGALMAKLREARVASPRSQPGDFVFVTPRVGNAHDHRNIGRVLARALKAAKLDDPQPTFHSLRHSHASRLIAGRMDIQEVADRLGHASISVTQDTYAHAFDQVNRSPQRRAMIEELYGGKPPVNADGSGTPQTADTPGPNVADLGEKRAARQ